jgi:hypothetical protein
VRIPGIIDQDIDLFPGFRQIMNSIFNGQFIANIKRQRYEPDLPAKDFSSSRRSVRRPAAIMRKPFFPNNKAVARPMPEVAPVIKTVGFS